MYRVTGATLANRISICANSASSRFKTLLEGIFIEYICTAWPDIFLYILSKYEIFPSRRRMARRGNLHRTDYNSFKSYILIICVCSSKKKKISISREFVDFTEENNLNREYNISSNGNYIFNRRKKPRRTPFTDRIERSRVRRNSINIHEESMISRMRHVCPEGRFSQTQG